MSVLQSIHSVTIAKKCRVVVQNNDITNVFPIFDQLKEAFSFRCDETQPALKTLSFLLLTDMW